MKIKTNIYHFTCDNGEKYEDFTGYSATVHARNENEAVQKGLKEVAKNAGYNDTIGLCHAYAELQFENVEMDVPILEPLKKEIGGICFEFDYSTKNLTINYGYAMTSSELQTLRDFLNEVIASLE